MGTKSEFGKESRLKSLREHYDETGPYDAETAWMFVYRELLWFDGSNGLAHLYESDKAQPTARRGVPTSSARRRRRRPGTGNRRSGGRNMGNPDDADRLDGPFLLANGMRDDGVADDGYEATLADGSRLELWGDGAGDYLAWLTAHPELDDQYGPDDVTREVNLPHLTTRGQFRKLRAALGF